MLQLYRFLYRYRIFLYFLFLEIVALALFSNSQSFFGSFMFSSANRYAAGLLSFSSNVQSYFDLQDQNNKLREENELLLNLLANRENNGGPNNLTTLNPDYQAVVAKVINNSVYRPTNYITINKGRRHGIAPGMGVISSEGIVGKVKLASEQFATITSVLHTEVFISSQIKSSNTLCSVKWDGRDPRFANLLYVPQHISLQEGDSVVTSGYNAIYPEGILIGTITSYSVKPNETFYNVRLRLSTPFAQLASVFVIRNQQVEVLDSLEAVTEIR